MFGIEVGGLNHVRYAQAFNEADTRISINQRVLTVEPDADGLRVEVGSDHSDHRSSRLVEHVIVDHGTQPLDELYFDLKPSSSNLGAVDYEALIDGRPQTVDRNDAGSFQLFRIGDAIAGRNIHAAIYDALRLVKDL